MTYLSINFSDRPDLYQPIPEQAMKDIVNGFEVATKSLQNILLSLGVLTWRDLVGLTVEALEQKPNITQQNINRFNEMLAKIDPRLYVGAAPGCDLIDAQRFLENYRKGQVARHDNQEISSTELQYRRIAVAGSHTFIGFEQTDLSRNHIKVSLRDTNDETLCSAFLRCGHRVTLRNDDAQKPVTIGYSWSADTRTAFSIES